MAGCVLGKQKTEGQRVRGLLAEIPTNATFSQLYYQHYAMTLEESLLCPSLPYILAFGTSLPLDACRLPSIAPAHELDVARSNAPLSTAA